jgi:hypothetical protein
MAPALFQQRHICALVCIMTKTKRIEKKSRRQYICPRRRRRAPQVGPRINSWASVGYTNLWPRQFSAFAYTNSALMFWSVHNKDQDISQRRPTYHAWNQLWLRTVMTHHPVQLAGWDDDVALLLHSLDTLPTWWVTPLCFGLFLFWCTSLYRLGWTFLCTRLDNRYHAMQCNACVFMQSWLFANTMCGALSVVVFPVFHPVSECTTKYWSQWRTCHSEYKWNYQQPSY